MAADALEQNIARAVNQAYDAWAALHPNLAAVIDRITVTDHAAESLRATPEYRQAVADFHAGLAETDLLNRLLDLAGPILANILQS